MKRREQPHQITVDELAAHIACSDFRNHQFSHRREGAGWVCLLCNPPQEKKP